MTELARTVRSGVVESRHDGVAIAVDSDGAIVRQWGDTFERVFYRSAIKPFQATVSQRNGAALIPEQMAMACASHGGHPVHVGLVAGMLAEVGLTADDLGCPPARPLSIEARLLLARRGAQAPKRIHHTCSGKHTAFLRACVARQWPTDSYLDPGHPLQSGVFELIGEATGESPEPVGTDGCGAPIASGTVRGLATAFARLSQDPVYADAAVSMARYPALVADNLRSDGVLGAWWGGPVKSGAQGLMAAGRHGIGIAVRSTTGSSSVAMVGLIEVMKRLDLLSDAAVAGLDDVATPAVLGGGRPVGALVPSLED